MERHTNQQHTFQNIWSVTLNPRFSPACLSDDYITNMKTLEWQVVLGVNLEKF